MLSAIRGSNGVVARVSEQSIWEMAATLGRMGVYVEPTSATAAAAAEDLMQEGTIAEGESVAIVLTGSGLKATDKIVAHYF